MLSALLSAVCFLLSAICCLLFAFPPGVWRLPLAAGRIGSRWPQDLGLGPLLSAVCCLVSGVWYLVSGVCRYVSASALLSAVCCPPSCLLSTAGRIGSRWPQDVGLGPDVRVERCEKRKYCPEKYAVLFSGIAPIENRRACQHKTSITTETSTASHMLTHMLCWECTLTFSTRV